MKKLLLLIALIYAAKSFATTQSFDTWIINLKDELHLEHGLSHDLLDRAFNGVTFNEDVIKYDRRQPEFVMSMGRYMSIVISSSRVQKGQRYLNELSNIFNDVSSDFNFQREYLLSFWAMETNYSANTGKLDIIRSLATLSYDGRRSKFFKAELINTLKMMQRDIYSFPGERMQGSWAGAMGSTQFMPSNMLAYAIDYSGDGTINMWENRRDFFGSSANFLNKVGWKGDERWGHEVVLPSNFDYYTAGLHNKTSLQTWKDQGVTLIDGSELPHTDGRTSLYLPQGHTGPAFVVYDNFFTIFRWNNSAKYALAISTLSDLILDRAPYFSKFNLKEETFMTFGLAKEIQTKLNELGHDAGPVDGIPGKMTFRALQKYQDSLGLVPDGYLSKRIVDQLLSY